MFIRILISEKIEGEGTLNEQLIWNSLTVSKLNLQMVLKIQENLKKNV
jgi:hypothetical protein